MKENSFVRLWGYLKVYKAAVLLPQDCQCGHECPRAFCPRACHH